MANQDTKKIDNIIASRRAMLLGGGAALAAMAMPSSAKAAVPVTTFSDFDILNFALNLEYLEANFYYMAAFGCTINAPNQAAINAGAPSGGIPTGANGATGGTTATVGTATAVPFTLAAVKSYAIETAIEEGKHVQYLQNAIKQFGGTPVAQPAIDISPAGAFTTLGNAAGVSGAPFITGGQFNPYANDVAFLAGAYVFEDVGVTAYHGAAPYITTGMTGKTILAAAVKIHAVEAYHAGLIRSTIYIADPNNTSGYLTATQKVSQLRTNLAHAVAPTTVPAVYSSGIGYNTIGYPDDFGLYPGTYPLSGTTNPPSTGNVSLAGTTASASNVADADPAFVIGFARTTTEVLNIVTGGGAAGTGVSKGVFFPSGLNGTFQ
jgi:hypothetical protein